MSKITPAKGYKPPDGDPAAGPRGRHRLLDRLTAQVGSESLATGLLKARGHMDEDGNLTAAGKARDAMSAEERAIDRATKRSKTKFGQFPSSYTYDSATNRAVRKKGSK